MHKALGLLSNTVLVCGDQRKYKKKERKTDRAGQMVQQLRTLVSLLEDACSIPSTPMVPHNPL